MELIRTEVFFLTALVILRNEVFPVESNYYKNSIPFPVVMLR